MIEWPYNKVVSNTFAIASFMIRQRYKRKLSVFLFSQLPRSYCSFFPARDIISAQAVFESVMILTVEEVGPARLLAQVFQDRVVLLSKDPDTLLCMPAAEGQLRELDFLLGERFHGRAVTNKY